MGSVQRRGRIKVNRGDWQEEFNRGKREYALWIDSEKSRKNIARRKEQTSDPYEKAFFFGVLTGSKANQSLPAPRQWKPPARPKIEFNPPPGWKPRMVKRK